MSEQEATTATKVRHLVDVRLVAEPPQHVGRWSKTMEAKAKALEEWVEEFHDFIRDHRSADPVVLEVERVIQDVCSACEREWETMPGDADHGEIGKTYCANCGVEVSP